MFLVLVVSLSFSSVVWAQITTPTTDQELLNAAIAQSEAIDNLLLTAAIQQSNLIDQLLLAAALYQQSLIRDFRDFLLAIYNYCRPSGDNNEQPWYGVFP
ncbi:MAG: hypothetical protein ABH822_02235 [Patescibacteria group bacterium]